MYVSFSPAVLRPYIGTQHIGKVAFVRLCLLLLTWQGPDVEEEEGEGSTEGGSFLMCIGVLSSTKPVKRNENSITLAFMVRYGAEPIWRHLLINLSRGCKYVCSC